MVLPRTVNGMEVEPQMVDAGTYCSAGEEVSVLWPFCYG